MNENITRIQNELSEAKAQIFRSDSGSSGYHLVYALQAVMWELIALRALIKPADKRIPTWDASSTYTEPAYVMYEGRLCVVGPGVTTPVAVPHD